MKVCAYYKLDPFKEDKTFEQWVNMYLTMLMVEYEELTNVRRPLAELTGEIAGGLFNPDGLKQYHKMKESLKISKGKNGKKGVLQIGSNGGMAISNTKLDNGRIVDEMGNEVISMENLMKFLQKQSNL
jgi:hypothetical protein